MIFFHLNMIREVHIQWTKWRKVSKYEVLTVLKASKSRYMNYPWACRGVNTWRCRRLHPHSRKFQSAAWRKKFRYVGKNRHFRLLFVYLSEIFNLSFGATIMPENFMTTSTLKWISIGWKYCFGYILRKKLTPPRYNGETIFLCREIIISCWDNNRKLSKLLFYCYSRSLLSLESRKNTSTYILRNCLPWTRQYVSRCGIKSFWNVMQLNLYCSLWGVVVDRSGHLRLWQLDFR